MLRYIALALLVASATALPSISQNPLVVPKVSPRGVVEGVTGCGSQGKILEIRVTDCSKLPCDLTVSKTYTIEVDFIPSASHPSLNVLVSIIAGGSENQIINTNVPVAVEAGLGYTVAYPLTITGEIALGLVALRIQVAEGGVTELCGLATANIHN